MIFIKKSKCNIFLLQANKDIYEQIKGYKAELNKHVI